MKHLFFIFILSSAVCHSQSTDNRIKEIKKLYKELESNLSRCKKISFQDLSDPNFIFGGASDQTLYLDTITNKIIKVVEQTYYDWHDSKTSFYFNDNDCFFIFEESSGAGEMYTAEELGITEEELWQRGGEAKTIEYDQNRYYFDITGKCIRHLNKHISVKAEQDEPDYSEIKNEEMNLEDSYPADLRKHAIFLLEYALKKAK